ncbi:MAG: hypothetical protein RR553_09675 [Akkermansia sp.]
MKMLKLSIVLPVTLLTLGSISLAYAVPSASSPAPSAQQNKSGANATTGKKVGQNKGVRFVLSSPCNDLNKIYMPISATKIIEVPLRYGLPAARVPYPEDGTIRLYKTEITPSSIKKEIPFVTYKLPPDTGIKTLLIMTPTDHSFVFSFFNESNCKPGSALIKNMTSLPYLINIPAALTGEKKQNVINSNASFTYPSTTTAKRPLTTPIEIRKQVADKSGTLKWFIDRQMVLRIDPSKTTLILLLPAPSGRGMMLHEIPVFKD